MGLDCTDARYPETGMQSGWSGGKRVGENDVSSAIGQRAKHRGRLANEAVISVLANLQDLVYGVQAAADEDEEHRLGYEMWTMAI